jgi:hypothetical protein
MKHLTLAILTALLLSATPATAQELWGGAHADMSVAQVQKIFSTLEIFPTQEEGKGQGMELYRSRQTITIQENPYEPWFKFVGGKLGLVLLEYEGKDYNDGVLGAGNFDLARRHLFSPVLAALRAKYGPEQSAVYKAPKQSIVDITVETDQRVWITNNRRISLFLSDWRSSRTTIFSFNIKYEPLAKADLDKL